MSTRSRTLAAFVLVLLSVWGIGATAVVTPATADPASAPGWMPEEPPPLTAEQQQWLKPLDGTDEDGKYLVITCHDHREFAGCAPHDPSEQSKDIDAYVFNASDRSYAGVKAMVPEQLAKEHRELLDDNGVLDCEKARNKIPACANPGGAPKPAQFDEQGRFVKLTEGGVGQADTNVDLSALNPANAAKDLLDNWFAQACESVGKFAGDLLVLSMTWWLRTDSIDVTSGGILAGERPVQILVMMVLALGILSAAITMALSRRPGPAAELGVGAFKFLLICSLSGIVVTGALHAADDFARQITANGAEEFGPNLKAMLGIATIRNPGGVLLLGVVAFVLGAVQWLIGFARQAGLVILFAMLIFAAAGQLSSWGRQWFPRIVAMMLALILYKPFAAALYTIGFKLMGNEQSLSSVMVGLMTIGLCVLTLPTMLAFFKWVSPGAQGGASVGTVLAGGGAIAAAGMGQFAGGGAGGDSQSNYMDSTGPGSSGGGEADPSPGNSPGGFGSGGGGGESTDGSSGGEAGGSSPEADLGAGDLGPASEAPDAGGGVPMPGGAGGGADAAGAAGGAEAAGGGAAAANPYVAAAMAAKETVETAVDTVGEVAEGAATEATGGDDTGPDMQ